MRQLKFGVLIFPGSNGDQDCLYLLNEVYGVPTDAVWHGETSDALTDRADVALYEAKNAGRNRIVEAVTETELALYRPA